MLENATDKFKSGTNLGNCESGRHILKSVICMSKCKQISLGLVERCVERGSITPEQCGQVPKEEPFNDYLSNLQADNRICKTINLN